MLTLKESAAGVGIVAILLFAGGCTSYYKVTDPHSGLVYYTTSIDKQSGGALTLKDGKTEDEITLQNSRVQKITKDEFEDGRDISGTDPNAEAKAAAAKAEQQAMEQRAAAARQAEIAAAEQRAAQARTAEIAAAEKRAAEARAAEAKAAEARSAEAKAAEAKAAEARAAEVRAAEQRAADARAAEAKAAAAAPAAGAQPAAPPAPVTPPAGGAAP